MKQSELVTYPPFFQTYISALAGDYDLQDYLETSLEQFEELFYGFPEEKQAFRYAENKWSVKEVIQHMIDAERVFVYRALRFSRNDQTDLPGFDENSYVENYSVSDRTFDNLLDEFCLLRRSTISMYQNFKKPELKRFGHVDGNAISVAALGFICSGHVVHHLKVIRERYL